MSSVRVITLWLQAIVLLAIVLTTGGNATAATVFDTSATLSWAPASGPVVEYAVYVNRNGAGFGASPEQVVGVTQVTLDAAFGDFFVIKIAALDAFGNQGPYSADSDSIDFTRPAAVMQLSQTTLAASTTEGSSPVDAVFSITNTGQGQLDYQIASSESWLGSLPISGSALAGVSDAITVHYDADSLSEGVHTATLTISATGLASQQIDVTLTVEPPPAVLALSKASMMVVGTGGFNAPSQTFLIQNAGGGVLSYSISNETGDLVDWISVSPSSGTITTGTDTITVSFGTSGLTQGTYLGTVTVSATGPGTETMTQEIAIDLTVTAPLGVPGQPIVLVP